MAEMPYVCFYPSDWLAGTRGLTAAETGVYITLVAMMYERGGPLDMDDARLARLCGSSVPAFQKAVEALVSEGKITRTDAGLFNNRVGAELKKRAEKCAGAAANANARWQKAKEKQAPTDADAMQTQCGTDANQNHIHIREEKNPPTPRKRGMEIDPPGFAAFWEIYPRKVAKGSARKAWAKATQQAPPDAIIAAARRVEDRGEYTPHPATWLNAERWTDQEPQHVARIVPGVGEGRSPQSRLVAAALRVSTAR